MSAYLIFKALHVCTAIISILSFIIRGIWMMQSSSALDKKWVRITPHINDTLLLVSAIVLVIITAQYPGPAVWINAKIIGLIVYIVLGVIALKRGKTLIVRIIAWVGALASFAFVYATALHKSVYIPF